MCPIIGTTMRKNVQKNVGYYIDKTKILSYNQTNNKMQV